MSPKRVHFIFSILLASITWLALVFLVSYARPVAAAPGDTGCGDVVINEIKFKQDGSSSTNPWKNDEWVELYVSNGLPAGAILTLDDMETGTGRFQITFTLSTALAADKYIVVHAKPATESESPMAGDLQVFDAGSGSTVLNNTGDNIVLYVNSAACEEVHWGTRGSSGNNGPPSPAAPIEYAYGSASNISAGESIQRDPNGTGTVFLQGDDSAFAAKTTIGYNNNGPSTLVDLASFTAIIDDDSVLLNWETGAEIDNAGFNLYRADSASGPQVKINEQLLAARGNGMGAMYAYEDEGVSQGAHHYWLEDVDYAGGRTLHGPVQVVVREASVPSKRTVFLPIVTGG